MKIEGMFRILLVIASCWQASNGATNQVSLGASPYTPAYRSHLRSCQAFTDLLQLVEDAQENLQSFQAAFRDEPKNETTIRYATHRARLWLNKFHGRLARVAQLCSLPRPLENILEEQLNLSYKNSPVHAEGDEYAQGASAGQKNQIISGAKGKCHSSKRERKTCFTALAEELVKIASRGAASPDRKEDQRLPDGEVLRLLLEILRLGRRRKPLTNAVRQKDVAMPVGVVEEEGVVEVNMTGAVREVPSTFLSVALGSRLIQHGWMTFNTSSPLLLTLTRALAPGVLRMGGSSANFLTYDPTVQDPSSPPTSEVQASPSFEEVLDSPEGPHGVPSESQDVKGNVLLQRTEGKSNPTHSGASGSHRSKGAAPRAQTLHTDHRRHDHLADESDADITNAADLSNHTNTNRTDSTNDADSILVNGFRGSSLGDGRTELPSEPSCDSSYSSSTFVNFTMTAGDWTRLLDFVEAVGMQLLFDLNQFYRDEEGEWDASNARLIQQDAAARGAQVIWQLGNEPNSYLHNYNFTISGEEAAKDFGRLEEALSDYFPMERDRPIVGPDVTRPRKHHLGHAAVTGVAGSHVQPCLASDSLDYLEEYLQNLRINLTAISWHQYYVNGHTAELEDFLSVDVLEEFVWQTSEMVQLRDRLAPRIPLWLTETSSAWGGGAPGLSNAFAGGFLWLDKLGVAALGGVDLVARQTLYKGSYALIDEELLPYPDYWLSVLYKRLVGGRVLSLSLLQAPPTTRLYAHCLNNLTQDYIPGGIVVYGMNLANQTTEVSLSDDLVLSLVLQYLLQAPDGDLRSGDVLLNGLLLEVTAEGDLPDLQPVVLPPGRLRLPSTSFGFWVLPHAHAQACM